MSLSVRDLEKQCGCPEGLWSKCAAHPWHLVGRHDGQRVSKSLKVYAKRRGLDVPTTRAAAEELAKRIIGEIEGGTFVDKPRPKTVVEAEAAEGALTFDQAVPKFMANVVYAKRIKTASEVLGRLTKFGRSEAQGEVFGAIPLADITEGDIEDVFLNATEDAADETRRKYCNDLTRVFAWCVRKGHLGKNPITEDTVMHWETPLSRTRRLKAGEQADLVEAAREGRSDAAPRLVAIIVAALYLGCRLGELLALQWRDVLWDEGPFGRILIRAEQVGARKNRKPRHVPMTVEVVEQLRILFGLNPTGKPWPVTAYVFGDAIGGKVTKIRKAWMTAVLRCHRLEPIWEGTTLSEASRLAFKQLDLHFHDLRHECALRWRERGYSLGAIAGLLGHSNLNTLRVYLGITQADAMSEAERLLAETQVPLNAEPEAAAVANDSKTTVKPARAALTVVGGRGGARRQVAG